MGEFFSISESVIRDFLKDKKAKGILVIVDGMHLKFKTAKPAAREMNSIFGNVKNVFKNIDGKLVFDFDGTKW